VGGEGETLPLAGTTACLHSSWDGGSPGLRFGLTALVQVAAASERAMDGVTASRPRGRRAGGRV